MSKSGNNIPQAILSFVKSSEDSDEDDDRALLIPSYGSSFNLAEDTEVLLPKSTSHFSSRGASNSSGSSKRGTGSGSKHHRRRSSGKEREFFDSSQSSAHTKSSGGSSKSRSSNKGRKQRITSPIERHDTMPERSSSGGNIPVKKSSSASDMRGLSHPTSDTNCTDDNIRESKSQTSINTIHSGHSYKSQKSSRSGKSIQRRRNQKLKRQEKRREWVRNWRRRRLFGTVILTIIYSMLCAYTLLVTLGPLALYYMDPDLMDWCPYFWDSIHNEQEQKRSDFTLNIDQLQKSKQEKNADVEDTPQQTRRLVPDSTRVEINLLKKTSKDVHTNANDRSGSDEDEEQPTKKYENPDYDDSPCHLTRIPFLFYLTLEECDLSRRMAVSVLLGGLIGYERRASDRPAGIRTMALVSLGSCFFTISSQLAFRDSPMTWDSSRVTAAIPSGVGFLGAGLIWKGSLSDGSGGEVHQVHGITTAASVWLSAAMGCGAGGALYAVSIYATALVILVLRFGPRLYFQHDKGFEYDEEEEEEEDEDTSDTGNRKHVNNEPAEETIPNQSETTTQPQHYEMQHMSNTNDTACLKKNTAQQYGSTDIEQNTAAVTSLLQQDQLRRQVERVNQLSDKYDSQPSFLSWLANLLPGGNKERQQPPNPYQEIHRDREVMKMMKRKKSMSKIKSRPSFCT